MIAFEEIEIFLVVFYFDWASYQYKILISLKVNNTGTLFGWYLTLQSQGLHASFVQRTKVINQNNGTNPKLEDPRVRVGGHTLLLL